MPRGTTNPKCDGVSFRSGAFFFRVLCGIALIALLLRLGVGWELGQAAGGANSVFSPSPASDLHTYMKLGREAAAGCFPKEFYYQPFYYAVFLPAIYRCSGNSVGAVVVVQAILGSLTVLLAGLIARRLFGNVAGWTAAGLTALSTPLLLYTPFHQNETLQAFLLTLLFWLFLRALRRRTPGRWALTGATAGIAVLTRGNAWFFLPLLLWGVWCGGRKSFRSRAAATLILPAALLAVQLPFIVHNTLARGRLTGPSTAADAVLALGNTEEAPAGGRNPGWYAGPMEYPESYHRAMALTQQGVSLPRQMFQWLCREPGAFLELQFRKLLLFWDHREIPNNVSLEGESKRSLILRTPLPGRSLVLLSLCLAGMLWFLPRLFRRYSLRLWMLYGFIVLYWGAVAAFYILSRFRAPILPLAAVMGGGFCTGVLHCRRSTGEARRLRLLLAAACFGTGLMISGVAYDLYSNGAESAIMRLIRPEGIRLDAGGANVHYFDYGPVTFGGWEPSPLQAGAVLTKRFGADASGAGELEWSVVGPGALTFRTNGGKELFRELAAGVNKLRFPVVLRDGKARIEIAAATEGVFALIDRHRNYGRSALNGKTESGEWVARFLAPRLATQ